MPCACFLTWLSGEKAKRCQTCKSCGQLEVTWGSCGFEKLVQFYAGIAMLMASRVGCFQLELSLSGQWVA